MLASQKHFSKPAIPSPATSAWQCRGFLSNARPRQHLRVISSASGEQLNGSFKAHGSVYSLLPLSRHRRSFEPVRAAATGDAAVPAPSEKPAPSAVKDYLQLWTGLGLLYAVDFVVKKGLAAAQIKFPSSLVGMFSIAVLLLGVGENAAASILGLFAPTLNWIAKWLPLFYIASLVTLPLSLQGISNDQLIRIFAILCAGAVGTLLFTAFTAVFIRRIVRTHNREVSKAKPASPFLRSHWYAWGAVAVASLIATVFSPHHSMGPHMALPFNVACTVLGFLIGNAMPKEVQAVVHPIVMTALVANAGAAIHGHVLGLSYKQAQMEYYTHDLRHPGAGDFLMGFLGMVIISMGFRIYQQRDTMKRHAPEILGATLLSSLFSFFSTALASRLLGLQPILGRALIPRSVTVALALPIAAQLDAPTGITAAAVLLQGMIGANFGPGLMTAAGVRDTIARGLSAAATAGGLGTASLTAKEPEALPFCALSYSMVGILSTVLASLPVVREALIAIVG